jgi:F-type H+-transporting ATPase subunit delta
VVVVVRHDPSLIAGVVTKIGDRVIDGSLRARLDNFRDTLLRS